ncbi:MAG: SAM-dependent DNA methyltransferase, partial [Pseudomonadota bacterium]
MDHHHIKQRVADFGEVFTAPREVEAMVDLVGHEADRLDSRFLEPACGDGNFLAVILTRKLAVAERLARLAPANFARLAIQAVTSLYGVEIQQGHVEACRKRLLAIVAERAERHLDDANLQPFLQAIIAVLARNILWGDALTLKEPNSE